MKKKHLSQSYLLNRARQWGQKFAEDHDLFPTNKTVWLAVSGGLDSMVMLRLMYLIKLHGGVSSIKVIHIDHNVRAGHQEEAELVLQECRSLKIPCYVEKLERVKSSSNLEATLREQRYAVFNKILGPGERLALAHHLDDSFEWSLLQQLKSTNPKTSLGIPLRRGPYIRPLLCFSRAQLEKIARCAQIPCAQDPTNNDTRFQRNYLRQHITPHLKAINPQYLKAYANRSNTLASALGVHLKVQPRPLLIFKKSNAILLVDKSMEQGLEGQEQIIRECVEHLSLANRGKVQEQIKKIISSAANHKTGPLLLSGGVKVFMRPNMLLIAKKDFEFTRKSLKFSSPKKFSLSEFEKFFFNQMNSHEAAEFFPLPVLISQPNIKSGFAFRKFLPPLPLSVSVLSSSDLIRLWKSRPALEKQQITLQTLIVPVG